jgi:hypothetical protein
MTDEEYNKEKIKDYARDILRLHTKDELRERFPFREHPKSFDDTFAEMGKRIDPDTEYPIWLGYEFLCDVDEKYQSEKHRKLIDKLFE